MYKKFLKASITLFLAPIAGNAQLIDSKKITVADIIIFHSNILKEDRKIYIHKPPDDTTYLPHSYPVLYLMDGEEQMAMVTGQVIYLSQSFNIISPMIVVGIGNNDRTQDLTPTHLHQEIMENQIPALLRL
jgi:enterochelin esterase-like enzyme